jgi:parallel beta-helix repeat protein
LLCSIILCFSFIPLTKTCFAQETGAIYIKADGSIDPFTAPISTIDNVTYTLTGDIFNNSIVVERGSIILDGAFHTIEGTISGGGIAVRDSTNVTIENFNIKTAGLRIGPYSDYATILGNNITDDALGLGYSLSITNAQNNTIYDNNITNNGGGISLYNSRGNSIYGNNILGNNAWGISIGINSSNNTIYGNNLTNNFYGIGFDDLSNNNTIYHNDFMNNYSQVHGPGIGNFWDNGSGGNYWSDYNGTDSNQDGIGDTPYIIDVNNTDHYPLMSQYVIPELPSLIVLPLFIIATLLAIVIYKRKHLT